MLLNRNNSQSPLSTSSPSRRCFLKQTAAVTAIVTPTLIPRHVLCAQDQPAANDRVNVGLIGAGTRGRFLSSELVNQANLVAVCDCFLPRCDELAARYREQKGAPPTWKVYQNYETMFDSEKIDAVAIATPDHGRIRPAIIACLAGIDVYAEKPMTFSIPEGQALIKAVRKHQRVLQVGTQQRSMEVNRYICKQVRDGALGKVSTVVVRNMSAPKPVSGLDEQPVPTGLDWNRFLAQAPMMPYNEMLQFKWKQWEPLGGGIMADRGAHALDMVNCAMGWDDTGPSELWPTIEKPNWWDRGVRMRYADGTEVRVEDPEGPWFGGIFVGEKGKLEINRNTYTSNPVDMFPPVESHPVTEAKHHIANWLDCIKTRKDPNAPVEVGHRASSVAHLINICRKLGRHLQWDPVAEQFVNDDEANELLIKPRRQEFALHVV